MLLEFYGKECSHCIKMEPLVEKLEKEEGVKVEQYEVWHNAENAEKQKEYDKGYCGGTPFFFNTDSQEFICGSTSFEELKNWAIKKVKQKDV
jgi:thiol-disulfide isomerase/thioredoxin